MLLSKHGNKRILDRTGMVAKDVLELLAHKNAYLVLGTSGGYTYILFYSPKDMTTKVAVVAADMGTLISIWEDNFKLPNAIPRVKEKHRRLAKQKYRAFYFSRLPVTEAQRMRKAGAVRTYTTRIAVYVNEKIVYEEVGNELSCSLAMLSETSVYEVNKDKLRSIVKVVEAHVKTKLSIIRYEIFAASNVPVITRRKYKFTHKTFLTRFKAATP